MNTRDILMRVAGGALIIAALGWFAYMNSGETVDVDFGLFAVHAVSVSIVIYGAILVGMVFMLAVSLRSDLRADKALKRYDRIAADVLSGIESPDGEGTEESGERAGDGTGAEAETKGEAGK